MFGNNHPFATKRWETDGQKVLLQVQRTPDADRELLDVASSQWEFNKLVQPYLKGVEFDEDQAVRWRPAGPGTPIVLDPKRRSGQPIVDQYGIPTSILASAVRAEGDDEGAVAEWYEMPVGLVHAAVEFEQQYAS